MTPISICIIGRDEEKFLPRLFSSINKNFESIPHEVVFVDTGSEDGSAEIAKKFADKVCDFAWCDDFSAARNYAMEVASNDAIFFIDCDEEIASINIEELSKAISCYPDGIGVVRVKNRYSFLDVEDSYIEKKSRVCNRFVHHFEGKIGEHLVRINSDEPSDFYELDITILHHGFYGPEEGSISRVERNLPLLLEAVENDDLVKDANVYFMLGQSYNLIGEGRKAAEYMKRGMEEGECTSESSELLMALGFGYTLLHMDNHTEAISLVALSDKYKDSGDFLCLMGIVYLRNGMLDQAMEAFEAAMNAKVTITEGAKLQIPAYNMACIHELYGETEEAIELYKKCGNYEPAMERLQLIGVNPF